VVAALGAGAHSAAAYVIGGATWPGGVIRYHNDDPADAKEIAGAVKAWNHSGAHVHFIAVSASRADVMIVPWPKHSGNGLFDPDGLASVGYVPRNGPLLGPAGYVRGAHVWLKGVNRARGLTPQVLTIVAAHELGHVLGLNHSTKCATMDPSVDESCKQPTHLWQFICRVLQPDDIAGAVARYGGHARAPGPEFCDYFPAPNPPSQVTAKIVISQGYATVALSFTAPRGTKLHGFGAPNSVAEFAVYAATGHCSTAAKDQVGGDSEKPGAHVSTEAYPGGSGRYCFAVTTVDIYNRQSKPVDVWVTVPGAPPAAGFYATEDQINGLLVEFTDQSTAGGAVTYSWDFGDGGTSTQKNPTHTYGSGGDYTVTETVTDAWGQKNTTSQVVTVAPWPAPTADFYDGCGGDGQCFMSSGGNTVQFNDNSYSNSAGNIESWSWNFGDGTTSNQPNPVHTYATAGTYTVTLTVIDDHGQSNTTQQQVYIDS
jgi:PKD repeat protein